MAITNFAALTAEQKTVWARDTWKMARNMSFVNKFLGKDANSAVQRITELKRDEKGARAVITLVADLEGDGVAGDNTLEGNEEAIKSYDQVIQIDQLRNANRHKGKMAEQRSVVTFRSESKDVLAYWLADRIDQLAFLTLSGVAYTSRCNGAARTSTTFPELVFADDVSAPTSNRHRRWSATGGLSAANTASITSSDTPSYKMLVELKAYAKSQYVRGIKGPGGEEYYHVVMTPQGMAKLKLDTEYLANLRSGAARGMDNPLFSGSAVTVDGLVVHEFRHVYNTTGLASGSKWGNNTQDGQRVLFLGAQALGFADIGGPEWNEKGFDYDNQQGISTGKILGFLKPKFGNIYESSAVEDFGVISCYVAQ